MQTKIIKNKFVNNENWDLIEFIDDFGKIIKYEVVNTHQQKNVKSGTTQPEEIAKFNNKDEAINFFEKFNFKYLSNEPITGERVVFDGYRAFVISDDKNYKIYFALLDTDYNSKIDGDQKYISEIIQDKYGNLENCFYQIAVQYLKERISQNNLKSEEVDIMNYLFK